MSAASPEPVLPPVAGVILAGGRSRRMGGGDKWLLPLGGRPMLEPGSQPVAGVILAGGRSRRMGGGDKWLLPLGGRPLLEHVIERVSGQVRQLALNANGDASRFAQFRLPVIADGIPDYPGPLAGVLAGM